MFHPQPKLYGHIAIEKETDISSCRRNTRRKERPPFFG